MDTIKIMEAIELGKRLEFYSNAIVGFIVLQSIAFCYEIGKSEGLREQLPKLKNLIKTLIAFVTLNGILAVLAIYWLGSLEKLNSVTCSSILDLFCFGKSFLVVQFTIIQLYILILYYRKKIRPEG
jgi:hypothetical protein